MRAVLLFVLLFAAPIVHAESDDPRACVEARYAEIRAIIAENPVDHVMREKVKALTLQFVDFDAFASETIRATWNDLSEPRRREFLSAFRALIQATYARHFKPRQDLKITYRPSTRSDDARAEVPTTLTFEKSQVDVDYRLVKKADGRWWVYDLVIDEVSLMRNYRAQFRRILKQDGFDALLGRIRAAVARKESGADASDEL
jgi:phospholipid transport system substrate-binding protein